MAASATLWDILKTEVLASGVLEFFSSELKTRFAFLLTIVKIKSCLDAKRDQMKQILFLNKLMTLPYILGKNWCQKSNLLVRNSNVRIH